MPDKMALRAESWSLVGSTAPYLADRVGEDSFLLRIRSGGTKSEVRGKTSLRSRFGA